MKKKGNKHLNNMHGLKIIYNIIQGYFVQEVVWPVIPVHYEQSTQKCLNFAT